MRTLADYLAKVPPLHAGKPKFTAELKLILEPLADIQALIDSIPAAFDLDNAIGVQLDAVGDWVGQSRNIPVPIQNAWFSFDTPGLGFDQGYWQGPGTNTGLAVLDDETFRRLLRAVIVANNSDGTLDDIEAALNTYFIDPATLVFVLDAAENPVTTNFFALDDPARGFDAGQWYQSGSISSVDAVDMAMVVGIAGKIPNAVDLEILFQLLIPFKPAAVRILWEVTTVDGSPVFGFDVENQYIAGFDVGAWGADPNFVATHFGPDLLVTEGGDAIVTEGGENIEI